MLCQFCHSIVSAGEDKGHRQRSASNIEQAALSNCYFCYWILLHYQAAGNDVDAEHLDLTIEFQFASLFDEIDKLMVQFVLYGLPKNLMKMPAEGARLESRAREHPTAFILLPESHIGIPMERIQARYSKDENWRVRNDSLEFNSCSRLPSNTGHPDIAATAKSWLKNCEDNHKSCSENRDPSYRPKRLLQIYGNRIQLVLPTLRRPGGPYATLSYCWGPIPTFIKLRGDNMEELMKGIRLKDLPLTFRHAIKTARRLGINNIWIDSLCIIQSGPGSAKDWEEQAGLMKKVYANAVLNISASKATTAEEGFFTFRQTDILESCTLSKTFPALSSDAPKEYTAVVWDYFSGKLLSWPIGKRGWILQERLLAPRMLHFGPDQVYWECNEMPHASEAFTGGVTWPAKWALDFRVAAFELRAPETLEVSPIGLHNDSWMSIVSSYSRMQLTKPTLDKLMAIGGVAEQVAILRQDEYVAGIFRKTLPYALTWFVDPYWRKDTIPDVDGTYRAPSWSWASTDALIGNTMIGGGLRSNIRALATVKEIRIKQLNPSNRYGRLASAEIHLQGFLLKAQARVTGDASDVEKRGFVVDVADWKPPENATISWVLQFDNFSTLKSYAPAERDSSKMEDILMLLISDGNKTAAEGESPEHSYGVLLGIVGEQDRYKRLGVFGITGKGVLIYNSIVASLAKKDVILI